MKMHLRSGLEWMAAAAFAAAIAACGNATTEPQATGVALSEAPITGQISIADSSRVTKRRVTTTGADGTFSLGVGDLTPPYEVAVEWDADGVTHKLRAITGRDESLDVNPLTDAVFAAASDRTSDDHRSEMEERQETARRASSTLAQLQTVLAPLFERYGITDLATDRAAVRALLEDVRIRRDDGIVTVTNRATGLVIFEGQLRDLASGTFHPENMPSGTTTPPPAGTCTTFTYSGWGACQADGTQARSVLASAPAGCTGGSPVTTQTCTYVPPVTTCTGFTYSTWTACQPDGTQTRSILGSTPSGCTGGAPVTSQRCTYTPPVTTCSAFTYSAWGACQSDGTQSRNVLTSTPAGCTGGTPVTRQSCTYVPPVTTCSAFTYSAWGACQSNGTQSRTVATSSPAGCTGGAPVTTQTCTYTPPTQSCTTCHGQPPSTGKHSRHSFSCGTCHGTGYSSTTVVAATHQNGTVNLATSSGWNATSRSCANSCHGSRSW